MGLILFLFIYFLGKWGGGVDDHFFVPRTLPPTLLLGKPLQISLPTTWKNRNKTISQFSSESFILPRILLLRPSLPPPKQKEDTKKKTTFNPSPPSSLPFPFPCLTHPFFLRLSRQNQTSTPRSAAESPQPATARSPTWAPCPNYPASQERPTSESYSMSPWGKMMGASRA